MELILIIVLLVSGALCGFLLALLIKNKNKAKQQMSYAVLEEHNLILKADKQQLSNELSKLHEQIRYSEKQTESLRVELEFQKRDNLKSEQNLVEIRQQMQLEFGHLANKILQDNSNQFSNQSSEKISNLLEPMKERLGGFEKKLEDQFREGHKYQAELFGAFKEMFSLNKELKSEAERLVNTLRGDVKKMGSWGELILEKILEISGLKEGKEYKREVQIKDDQGRWLRPDVILYLPENKHVIIDSKVSLIAYERFTNSTDDQIRIKALNDHKDSVKNHIRLLGEKKYQSLSDLTTPDYVLLFMPIESAFSVALEADHSIFEYAWERKIVIVSPSTLLATLKTIHAIWQSEKQSRNAQEIARQGGALYDKFVNFVNELDKIGKQISQTQQTYSSAMKKLSSGKGNLINRVENLRSLGVKRTKDLDKYLNEEDALKEEQQTIH